MKLYPDVPRRRARTILRDVIVVMALLGCVWLGVKAHDAVETLTVLGSGVEQAGTTVQSGFDSLAGMVSGLPLIGDDLLGALQGAGAGTGGELAELGRQGIETIQELAWKVGVVVGGLPALFVLLFALPGRVRQVKRLSAASVLLSYPDDLERRRLMAMRAAFNLPYGVLLRYTRDPLGDLLEGHLDPLVSAALDDAGIVPRPPRSGIAPRQPIG